MRGGYDSHVDRYRGGRTDRAHLSSCKVRSNFIWNVVDISPISSRNSVPCGALEQALGLSDAPVNAPSAVTEQFRLEQCLGMAAQLTATNGRRLARLALWIARAISSLPVPVLPRISTLASLAATSLASSSIASICLFRVMMALRQALDDDAEIAFEKSFIAYSRE